jgi:hypothetical protein
MKHFSTLMVALITILIVTVSSALAGDPLADLFSQTKICFSHVAIAKGWETEIAVLNPTSKAVSGNLFFYDMQGNQLGGAVPITINTHGRYQVEVGAVFAQRGAVEYMLFTAPVYGLKGYSKFYNNHDGIRASIMASTPQKSGLFTKIDHKGWTGIAFVNTSSVVAHVTLTAYSDAGGEPIAIVPLDVKPGEKVVKTAVNIFAPQPIDQASYISFTSDQGLVGFFLNGSGNELDGSKAL